MKRVGIWLIDREEWMVGSLGEPVVRDEGFRGLLEAVAMRLRHNDTACEVREFAPTRRESAA